MLHVVGAGCSGCFGLIGTFAAGAHDDSSTTRSEAARDRPEPRTVMHELTLAANLLELIEQHARTNGLVQVLRVHLALGVLFPVDEGALTFGFEVACRGTVAEAAELRIERVPGRARCAACAGEFEVDTHGSPCPRCGSSGWRLLGGDDLRLSGLEGT